MGNNPPFDANARRMTPGLGSGAPLPSANLRAPYRTETKSPETSKRLDDVMLQYQQQQKMLQHKPNYFSSGLMSNQALPSPTQQQPPVQPQLNAPTSYGDPYALGYGGAGGGRMLVRDNQALQQQQQQQHQQLGGKYERKRVLADETNPIEPNISDPLFSVKRTHFHPPTGSSNRV